MLTFTSRSRIEKFLECPRAGYINYLWGGRGIVPVRHAVPLATGIYTHEGLAALLIDVKNGNGNCSESTDACVRHVVAAYRREVESFQLESRENSANFAYVLAEQCALVEAFIRGFALSVLPGLLERYEIIDVEKEELAALDDSLLLQGRLDASLRERSTGDLHVVSFKTAASWDERNDRACEHDIQGLTETYLLEKRLEAHNNAIRILTSTALTSPDVEIPAKVIEATAKYKEYVGRFLENDKVMGVLMIYMIKGRRYEGSTEGRWEQHSPLIRGYRKVIGADVEYAHSLYYTNPENKSGKGRLGKGWEPFNVWEMEGGVKEWIRLLATGTIQPDEGNILEAQFKRPPAYFRNQEDIDSTLTQIQGIEAGIRDGIKAIQHYAPLVDVPNMDADYHRRLLDTLFPQRKRACDWPSTCEYQGVCYNTETFRDPFGMNKYESRVPHHDAEKEEHERLYKIDLVLDDPRREEETFV